MKVFVIVVTYNSMKWIDKCYKSLCNSTLPVEMIFIDNGSTDGTLEYLKNTNAILIRPEENLGFGNANNLGIKKALEHDVDFLFLLNHDAWIENDTISKLVTFMDNHKEFGIMSPIHLNGSGSGIDNNFCHYLSHYNCAGFLSDLFVKKLKPFYEIGFVNAAAWLISKACLNTVGGFNPAYFMYGEDDNYIHRVHYHDFKTGIITDTIIYHDREGRNGNVYEEYVKKITGFSNPNSSKTIEIEKRNLERQIIRNKLLFRFKRLSNFKNQLKILKSLPSQLTINREHSKEKGRTFL